MSILHIKITILKLLNVMEIEFLPCL